MTKNITNDELAVMIKKGFDEIHDKFATKKDLKRFATKEDLKRFATKKDLKRFATKEDLKRFATKEDLKRFATKEDLKRFATKEDLNKKIDNVLAKEDYTVKLIQEVRTELAASTGARIRQEDKINKISKQSQINKMLINKHETRIKKLEFAQT